MKNFKSIWTALIVVVLLVVVPAHGRASHNPSSLLSSHHELTVILIPEQSMLTGIDRVRVQGLRGAGIDLWLSPEADIQTVTVNGRRKPYNFDEGRLRIDVANGIDALDLEIHYTGRFDDPAPVAPVNTDNPGYGVSGTIGPSGTFILSGAGWYPRLTGARESFDLRIKGPHGTVAVTAGNLVGIDENESHTISHWRVDNPLEGLSVSAGPYVVDRQRAGHLTAATFLYPGNRRLSPRYLEASLRHLKRYETLFGPYPFDNFSVVENFFPTGYGFPSYTLIGSRVLQLPFIPETSLPHEIVHNWWGNGVLVDFASGNWCEGLATYTADYWIKELGSAEAARDYRRQALRNYAALASPNDTLPLRRFMSRIDPVTKAIGYDKSAMVFHMLRQTIGDDAFWKGLRNLYREYRFQRASWGDLQAVFERQAGRSLDTFFDQWVTRPGAPRLRLEAVHSTAESTGFRTTGRLVQQRPYYHVDVDLVLETGGEAVHQSLRLTDAATAFTLPSAHEPRLLVADPDYHLFRQLAPEEIPATVNSLKGARQVVVVLADRMARHGRPVARLFTRAMGIDPVRWMEESELSGFDPTGFDLLFIGRPKSPQWTGMFPRDLRLSSDKFYLADQPFDDPADVLFCINRHSADAATTVALLHPLSPEGGRRALTKIPHYGRYSYLAFRDGRNRIKGTWETVTSPLKIRLAAPTTP